MHLVKIRQDKMIWYFDGVQPLSYQTTAQLTIQGAPTSGDFQWQVLSGPVVLENGTSNMTKPNSDPTMEIKSTGASAPAVAVTPDVHIQVSVNGLAVKYSTAVFAPEELSPLPLTGNTTDMADSTFGYLSFVHYEILDQFGQPLPAIFIEINEKFTTGQTSDYPPTTTSWRQSTASSTFVGPNDWNDMIGGENFAFSPLVPVPVSPTDPNANVPVAHWDGEWRIGSLTIGAGRLVQTNRWQKYQGRALHTNVQSPP